MTSQLHHRKLMLALSLLLALALLAPVAAAQETTTTIRAIWNTEIFVLLNNSDVGIDVTNLDFVSADGAIEADNWVELTDDAGEFYSLTDVRPGSCLVAYLAGQDQPALPGGADCTRIVAEFTPTSVGDIVWDIAQGGFTPVLGGVESDTCSVTDGTTCDVTANITGTVEADDSVPETVEVRTVWNPDIFVLINVSEFGADFSEVTFASETGQITAEMWVLLTDDEGVSYDLANARPGSCLVAYLATEGDRPDLPDGIECTQEIAELPLESIDDIVWSLDSTGFNTFVSEGFVEECEVEGTTTCDFSVPNADLMMNDGDDMDDMDGDDMSADADGSIRAVWTDDVLVLINVGTTGLDITGLTFSGETGSFPANLATPGTDDTGVSYDFTNVRPGSCVFYYRPGVPQSTPSNVTCTRIIGEVTLETINDVIWTPDRGSFTAGGATCSTTEGTSCDVPVPSIGE